MFTEWKVYLSSKASMCRNCSFKRTLSCNSWRHRPTLADFETVKMRLKSTKVDPVFPDQKHLFFIISTQIDSLLWNVGFWSISRLIEKHLFMSKPHRVLRLSILSGFNCLFLRQQCYNKIDWLLWNVVYCSIIRLIDKQVWMFEGICPRQVTPKYMSSGSTQVKSCSFTLLSFPSVCLSLILYYNILYI